MKVQAYVERFKDNDNLHEFFDLVEPDNSMASDLTKQQKSECVELFLDECKELAFISEIDTMEQKCAVWT